MAGIQWSGGKCHGAGEAKAALRHNDKGQRLTHSHRNPDIDLTLTHLNFSYFNKSYYQKVQKYDDKITSVKCKRKSSGKNSTVTMQDLVIYCPAGMMDNEIGAYDYDRVLAWFRDVGYLLYGRYGKCLIDMDVHFDEVHPYIEPSTKAVTWSRVHAHASLIPAIPEVGEDGEPTGELVLNAKQFSAKGNIMALNNAVHEMTMQKYGMPYLDGTKKKGNSTVEEKKRESAAALAAREAQIAAREAELCRREQECQELIILGRRAKAAELSRGIAAKKADTNNTARNAVQVEPPTAYAGGDALLRRPQHGFVIPRALVAHIREGRGHVCRFRLTSCPPEEGYGLGAGDGAGWVKLAAAHAIGDVLLHRPQDRHGEVVALMHIGEAAHGGTLVLGEDIQGAVLDGVGHAVHKFGDVVVFKGHDHLVVPVYHAALAVLYHGNQTFVCAIAIVVLGGR